MLGELLPAFALGLAATATPCALPLYPGFLAYLAANSDRAERADVVRWLGLFVLAGVLTMMIALGALIAALSLAVGRVLVVVTPLAELVVVALGVALLLGKNPFARLPQLAPTVSGGPLASAYVYGLLYGPIALPCSGALLVSIFTLSLSVTSLVAKLLFFLAFGVGFGVPLLLLSLLAPVQQSWLIRQFTRRYALVSRAAGLLLVVVATSDFAANWDAIALYLRG